MYKVWQMGTKTGVYIDTIKAELVFYILLFQDHFSIFYTWEKDAKTGVYNTVIIAFIQLML